MVGPLWPEPHTRAVIEPEPGLLALFGWDFQPFTLPDTHDPDVVHVPARLVEQPRHYATAIASILAGQLDDIFPQALFIGTTTWNLALGGAMLTKGAAGTAFG